VGGAGQPLSGPQRWARALECTPAALALVAAVTVTLVVLARWAEPLFGRYWRHVMWEGGLVEDLTALQFLVGAGVFLMAARAAPARSARRRWLGLYALAMLVLAGEETNYGRGTLLLDLADPNFAARYNPQHGNLHNFLPEAYIPVAAFFVIVAVLRVFHRPVVRRLGLPLPRGFLNATLLTLLAAPFMPYTDDRFLSVDEVYEWSGSLLLLGLAAACRWGWLFIDTDPGRHP
jgi:hypothetical protein